MKVKIKKLSEIASIPKYAKHGDAGLDLVATSIHFDDDGNYVYGTGISIEIPEGYVGLLFPRSSNAKKDLLLSNSVGVIDSGYRGEIIFKFKIASENIELNNERIYYVGDKVGQIIIMPYPQIEFEESLELSSSERGEGGFGSTNN